MVETDMRQVGLLARVLEVRQVRGELRHQHWPAPCHGPGQLGELRQPCKQAKLIAHNLIKKTFYDINLITKEMVKKGFSVGYSSMVFSKTFLYNPTIMFHVSWGKLPGDVVLVKYKLKAAVTFKRKTVIYSTVVAELFVYAT